VYTIMSVLDRWIKAKCDSYASSPSRKGFQSKRGQGTICGGNRSEEDHPALQQPVTLTSLNHTKITPLTTIKSLQQCPVKSSLHQYQQARSLIHSSQICSRAKSSSVPVVSVHVILPPSARIPDNAGRSGICYTIVENLMRLGADAVIVGRE
jgi:hypothetical protein